MRPETKSGGVYPQHHERHPLFCFRIRALRELGERDGLDGGVYRISKCGTGTGHQDCGIETNLTNIDFIDRLCVHLPSLKLPPLPYLYTTSCFITIHILSVVYQS